MSTYIVKKPDHVRIESRPTAAVINLLSYHGALDLDPALIIVII